MDDKTNVMRIIEQKKLPYKSYSFGNGEAVSGSEVAESIGKSADEVFKTLVCVGKSGEHYVFVVPAAKELSLKKAAKCVGEKSVEMIKQKDLLPLTGYVHGGCSPIGMKKFFKTTVDKTAESFGTICFSAGKIGRQVEMSVSDLAKAIRLQLSDITE